MLSKEDNELITRVGPRREVHRASVDGFHRPPAERYARGRTPETFYRDQYDHDAVRHRLVGAFRAGELWTRRGRRRAGGGGARPAGAPRRS